ncbi:MAG: Hsp20/alpha crystallin family protein [Planctomycetota bacterium]
MQLVTWSPWRQMTSLQNRMNRIFNDPFFRSERTDDGLTLENWNPVVDIYDNDDSVVIKADLPGLSKDDITIDLENQTLTVKGERSLENEVKEENYYRRERAFGKFHRAFTVPAEVNPDQIKANFKDGVLKIEIPKPEEQQPKQITVH